MRRCQNLWSFDPQVGPHVGTEKLHFLIKKLFYFEISPPLKNDLKNCAKKGLTENMSEIISEIITDIKSEIMS